MGASSMGFAADEGFLGGGDGRVDDVTAARPYQREASGAASVNLSAARRSAGSSAFSALR